MVPIRQGPARGGGRQDGLRELPHRHRLRPRPLRAAASRRDAAPRRARASADRGGAASRGVRSLRAYVRGRFRDESAYNRLWILEASTALEGILSTDERREVVEQLIALRRDDGGWALATLGPYDRVDGTPQAED